jgi:hypothetical protein
VIGDRDANYPGSDHDDVLRAHMVWTGS